MVRVNKLWLIYCNSFLKYYFCVVCEMVFICIVDDLRVKFGKLISVNFFVFVVLFCDFFL